MLKFLLLFVVGDFVMVVTGNFDTFDLWLQIVLTIPFVLFFVIVFARFVRGKPDVDPDIGNYDDGHWQSSYRQYDSNLPYYTRKAAERVIRAAELAEQRRSGRLLGRDVHFSHTLTDSSSSYEEVIYARYLLNHGPDNGVYIDVIDRRSPEQQRATPLR